MKKLLLLFTIIIALNYLAGAQTKPSGKTDSAKVKLIPKPNVKTDTLNVKFPL